MIKKSPPLCGKHGVELLGIKLLALNGPVDFGINGITQFRELYGETGPGHFVLVPAGNAPFPGQKPVPSPPRFPAGCSSP